MKARTMIYLEPEQLRALRARANELDISVAELVRRAVAEKLDDGGRARPASADVYAALVGIGESGLEDVSELHDEYLGTAVRRDHLR
jgi:hypothetical protein